MAATLLDPLKLAQMDKTRPLMARENTRETTCSLCGAPMSPGEWVVKLEGRYDAQPGCAGDAGWAIT